MLKPELLREPEIQSALEPDMYGNQVHGMIASLIVKSQEKAGNIDPASMIAVATREDLDLAGGIRYILDMPLHVTRLDPQWYRAHLRLMRQARANRRSLELISLATTGIEEGEEVDTTALVEQLSEIRDTARTRGEITMAEGLRSMAADYGDISSGVVSGVPSGFDRLDGFLGCLRFGSVYVLAARPGVGKSALALQIAYTVAAWKTPVHYISLEMPARDLCRRVVAATQRVNYGAILGGKLRAGEEEWAFQRGQYELASLPLTFDDSCKLDAGDVCAAMVRLARTSGVRLVVIDYLQLLRGARGVRYQTTNDRVAAATGAIKQAAMQADCAVLLLSQLNREAAKGAPESHHLRDSGAIEQDADAVLLMRRGDGMSETTVKITKHRYGRTGTVDLRFRGEFMRFDEVDQ